MPGNYTFLVITLTMLFAFLCSLDAQIIRGKIRDANTLRQITEVAISIEGYQIGTENEKNGSFQLDVAGIPDTANLLFLHVAYDTLRISIAEALTKRDFLLQERIIPLASMIVEAERNNTIEQQDIPQAITIIEAQDFEMRGYLDGGDLLRNEQSVQIEEQLQGEKNISIRGGNSDEVAIVYQGIRLNSAYDNSFDLALIDIEDVRRIEIVRGSNSALFGAAAFSGVVNIVPHRERDYTFRFRQRIGSFNSGDWGAHLYLNRGPLYGNYSYRKGAFERRIESSGDNNQRLVNTSDYHNAGLSFDFGGTAATVAGTLDLLFLRADVDFENQRDDEAVTNENQLWSLRFLGNVGPVRDLEIVAANQTLLENQTLNSFDPLFGSTNLEREFDQTSNHFRLQKSSVSEVLDLYAAYQFELQNLAYADIRGVAAAGQPGLQSADFQRKQHGVAAVLKWHFDTGSPAIETADFDVSFRHDTVEDIQEDGLLRLGATDSSSLFESRNWESNTLNFSAFLEGGQDDFEFSGYMNYGTNVKFPSLLQQISLPVLLTASTDIDTDGELKQEENRSLEVGLDFLWDTRDITGVYGIAASANYFRNTYKNKFRTFLTPGIPVAFYDNVASASIAGFEIQTSLFLWRKKLNVLGGWSFYDISARAAFPFKFDTKQVVKLNFDHAGYGLQLTWFKEGEQIGWIRGLDNTFSEVTLNGVSDMDFYFGKFFDIYRFRVFLNLSVRNILNDETSLSGITLRDRRYYATMAFQL